MLALLSLFLPVSHISCDLSNTLTDLLPYTEVEERSLITAVGNLVSGLTDGLGLTDVTDKLDELLGGKLTKVRSEPGLH